MNIRWGRFVTKLHEQHTRRDIAAFTVRKRDCYFATPPLFCTHPASERSRRHWLVDASACRRYPFTGWCWTAYVAVGAAPFRGVTGIFGTRHGWTFAADVHQLPICPRSLVYMNACWVRHAALAPRHPISLSYLISERLSARAAV